MPTRKEWRKREEADYVDLTKPGPSKETQKKETTRAETPLLDKTGAEVIEILDDEPAGTDTEKGTTEKILEEMDLTCTEELPETHSENLKKLGFLKLKFLSYFLCTLFLNITV